MITASISSFFKNMKSILVFIFIIILAIISLYNLIINKYTSFDIYFISYFFFLILYILFYFQDILKGKSGSEKFIRQVSLINLLLFFTGIIIYYILSGLGYISNKFTESQGGEVKSQNVYSQTIFYLIIFVFISFIFLYYRNNISSTANPYLDLIINILLYLPCCFINVIEFTQAQVSGIKSTTTTKDGTVIKTMKDGSKTKSAKEEEKSTIMKDGLVKTLKDSVVTSLSGNYKTYYIVLIIELVLIIFYIFTIIVQTIYENQGGINLIREPIELDRNVS
jgi:hypothetical protein